MLEWVPHALCAPTSYLCSLGLEDMPVPSPRNVLQKGPLPSLKCTIGLCRAGMMVGDEPLEETP